MIIISSKSVVSARATWRFFQPRAQKQKSAPWKKFIIFYRKTFSPYISAWMMSKHKIKTFLILQNDCLLKVEQKKFLIKGTSFFNFHFEKVKSSKFKYLTKLVSRKIHFQNQSKLKYLSKLLTRSKYFQNCSLKAASSNDVSKIATLKTNKQKKTTAKKKNQNCSFRKQIFLIVSIYLLMVGSCELWRSKPRLSTSQIRALIHLINNFARNLRS